MLYCHSRVGGNPENGEIGLFTSLSNLALEKPPSKDLFFVHSADSYLKPFQKLPAHDF